MSRFAVVAVLAGALLFSGVGHCLTIPPFDPGALEIMSNRHVQPQGIVQQVESFLDTVGFEMVAETDAAELWLAKDFHTIRIVDRRTGYVWGAIPLENARNLNKSWQSYAGSIVAIECYDSKHSERRYGLLSNANVTYELVDNGFAFSAEYSSLGITFTGRATLIGNKLTFQLDEGSVVESGEYRLKSLAFVPYLGSVFEDEVEGWFLLPDGPGALMRFRKSGTYIAGFDEKVYGPDLAIDQLGQAQSLAASRPDDYIIPPNQVLMPVYGIVHGTGQHGLLSVIEDGEQYASIVATPAGLGNTRYNSIMARFEYRQKYGMATTRSGASSLVPQEQMNMLTPKQSFYLLSGDEADYDQMAVFYRGLLMEQGFLKEASGPEMALRLEIIGGDVQQLALWKVWRAFTPIAEASEIIRELQREGLGNAAVVLRKFTKGNRAGAPLDGRLGSAGELAQLRAEVEAGGGTFALYLDPLRANSDQINLRLEAAHTMGKKPIQIVRNNWDAVYPETYFYRPDVATRLVAQHLTRYGEFHLALDQLGSRLYGDYTSGKERARRENTPGFVALMEELAEGRKLALYSPNQLMWPFAHSFYDLPLVSGQYLYETDTVPFLPMVLKGSMALYAPFVNTTSLSRDRILRMVEYGAYPSFIVTHAPSSSLAYTPLEDLHSTAFSDWKEYIVETYTYMLPALEKTAGLKITTHEAVEQGKVKVEYEGGSTILVNYTDEPWAWGGVVVGPHDYAVVERGEAW